MKIVVDTNVIVSALLSKTGTPAQIFSHEASFQLFTSEESLAEVKRVLHYDHIKTRYQLSDDLINNYLEHLRAASHVIVVHQVAAVIEADPDDNKFLACAVEAGADYIVSGDRHLKRLEVYRNIPILTPRQFLDLITQG
jgi:uncharacterized protein